MKTLQLIRLLSPKEKDEFRHHAQWLKNDRLEAAFSFLTKTKELPSSDLQAKVFKHLYKKNWTKENDYLLRNDLRLLGKQLELYLARKLFDQSDKRFDAEASCLYLTALLERKQIDLFLKEWQQVMRSAESNGNTEDLIRLRKLYILYLTRHPEFTEQRYQDIEVSIDELSRIIYFQQACIMQELSVYKSQLIRQRHESNPDVPLLKPQPFTMPDFSTDPHVRFFDLLSEAYLHRGEETISRLKEALEILEKCKPGIIDQQQREAVITAYIALELFLLGKYEEADHYYKRAMDQTRTIDPIRFGAIAFNYVSNLIRLEKYAEALHEIERYDKLFSGLTGIAQRVICQRVMCLIYTDRVKEAKQLILEHDASASYDVLFYMRLALSIAFFKEGKIDLCNRELENMEQSLRRTTSEYYVYIHIVRIFTKVVEQPINNRVRKSIADSITEFRKVWKKDHFDILPVKWIMDFAEQQLA